MYLHLLIQGIQDGYLLSAWDQLSGGAICSSTGSAAVSTVDQILEALWNLVGILREITK